MPTSYTADPTQTRAPAAKPGPAGLPIIVMPNDGEAANAASIRQAIQVLADYVGFSLAPHANPSQWAEAVMRYRNAQGHTRFAVDHNGLPGGAIVTFSEDWAAHVSLLGPNAAPGIVSGFQGWYWISDGANSALRPVPDASLKYKNQRCIALEAGDNNLEYSSLGRVQVGDWDADLTVAQEWLCSLQDPTFHAEWYAGFGAGDGGFTPNESATPSSGLMQYAVFAKLPADTHWQVLTKQAGAAIVSHVTSTVATTGWVRFRIEWHGANVADDGVAALRFYINGTLVHTVTSGLPMDAATFAATYSAGGGGIGPIFSMVNVGAGAATPPAPLILGPLQYAQSLYASDVL